MVCEKCGSDDPMEICEFINFASKYCVIKRAIADFVANDMGASRLMLTVTILLDDEITPLLYEGKKYHEIWLSFLDTVNGINAEWYTKVNDRFNKINERSTDEDYDACLNDIKRARSDYIHNQFDLVREFGKKF